MKLEDAPKRGQFDVRVDGRIVIERKGGLFAKLTRRPWPESSAVVDAVRAATVGPS